ncbi:MAG: hypothetical protein ACFFCW_25925 [Candidatus Hodarchaeota archaeon]
MAALKMKKSAAQLAQRFGVCPTMIMALIEGAGDIFDKNQGSRRKNDANPYDLHRQT